MTTSESQQTSPQKPEGYNFAMTLFCVLIASNLGLMASNLLSYRQKNEPLSIFNTDHVTAIANLTNRYDVLSSCKGTERIYTLRKEFLSEVRNGKQTDTDDNFVNYVCDILASERKSLKDPLFTLNSDGNVTVWDNSIGSIVIRIADIQYFSREELSKPLLVILEGIKKLEEKYTPKNSPLER